MNETHQCFLIEPVRGELREGSHENSWDARSIKAWKRKDTSEQRTRNNDFGVGAIYYATWYWKNMEWDNETEPHLIVRCPNPDASRTRDWDIDARCSNCGLPNDKLHRCWVRHGVPPLITVDKAGVTCNAGAGSIALPNWHGFLRNGVLAP